MMFTLLHFAVLSRMAWEDFKIRAIYLFWFPVWAVLWYLNDGLVQIADIILNLSWIVVQSLVLTLYFSIKEKKWINITKTYLGWGDIIMLGVAAIFLPTLPFLGLALLSFVCALVLGLIFRHRTIPLAGYFALVLMAFLLMKELQPGILNTLTY